MTGTETAESSGDDVRSRIQLLELAMERGSARTVSNVLGDSIMPALIEADGPESREVLAKARTWLQEARNHEKRHGPGSRLDRAHPWNIRYQPAIDLYRLQRGLGV